MFHSALFDSDEEVGSGSDMEVDEAPVSKTKSSSKPSAVLSKYAKKAAGFTDDNAEWLTLKKEVRPFISLPLLFLCIATTPILRVFWMLTMMFVYILYQIGEEASKENRKRRFVRGGRGERFRAPR